MVATGKSGKNRTINPDDWASCLAGAITSAEYKELLQKTGFREIMWLDENFEANGGCCSNSVPVRSVTWLARKLPLVKIIAGFLRGK